MTAFDIRKLAATDIELLRSIDRSEQLEVEYSVEAGHLVTRPTDFFVPNWNPDGGGEHSVERLIDFWRPYAESGANLIGAFSGASLAGLAMVATELRPGLAWLALFYVSRPYRRQGVGAALWRAVADIGRSGGATAIYVSAAPTGSAVGFYLQQGCRLAESDEIVAELFELEPVDVHLVCPL